jgi:hypothetical protein
MRKITDERERAWRKAHRERKKMSASHTTIREHLSATMLLLMAAEEQIYGQIPTPLDIISDAHGTRPDLFPEGLLPDGIYAWLQEVWWQTIDRVVQTIQ